MSEQEKARIVTAPITPDERAAMREGAESRDDLHPDDTLRLLDALDTTEEELEAAQRRHNTAFESVRTNIREYARAAEAWETQTYAVLAQRDGARAEVARLLAERDEARAASARVREAAARCVADEAAESELTIARQRDRLRAREEQVRRLRSEVTRLHALVSDLRAARPTPAWDEDTVIEAVASVLADHRPDLDETAVFTGECDCGWRTPSPAWEATEEEHRPHVAAAVLAVVREHLPAKPSRDEVIAALHGLAYEHFMAPHVEESTRVDLRNLYGRQADKVLSLLHGRSEAR